MGSYDTYGSGYMDRLPGMAPSDPHGYGTAQGSAGTGADGSQQILNTAANFAAESGTAPLIVPVQDTLAAGVKVPVHGTDTEVGGQVGLYGDGDAPNEIFGGVSTKQFGTGGIFQAPNGHANHHAHPNGDVHRPVGHA